MQNRISFLRAERALSLSALAKLVGTTKAQIQKLERGDRRLSLLWMQRIAHALDVKVSDLLPPEDVASQNDASEAAILNLIRRLPESDRATLVKVAQALVGNVQAAMLPEARAKAKAATKTSPRKVKSVKRKAG